MKRTKFGEAFAEARKAGKKTFDFGGKSYTTETKEEKAGATAKKAVRSFAANAVPGRRQIKPMPRGGGAIPTPDRSPSKERRGAGAIGRGGKDPVAPRDMTGVNQTPISGTDIAKSLVKGAASGLAAATPFGRFRKAATAAKAGPKLSLPKSKANWRANRKPYKPNDDLNRSLMKAEARAKANKFSKDITKTKKSVREEDNKFFDSMRNSAKESNTRKAVKEGFEKRFKDLKTKQRVAKAKSALREKKVTAGEASDMALGYRRGGKMK